MSVLLATTFGLALWIVLWALGAKAFDAMMVSTALIVLVATGRIVARYLPGRGD